MKLTVRVRLLPFDQKNGKKNSIERILFIFFHLFSRKWRNWQTRYLEGVMIYFIWVQVPSFASHGLKDFEMNELDPPGIGPESSQLTEFTLHHPEGVVLIRLVGKYFCSVFTKRKNSHGYSTCN